MIEKNDIEELLAKATPSERAEATILFNASVAASDAYRKKPISAALGDWQAANTALEEVIDRLRHKYSPEEVAMDDAQSFTPTAKPINVLRWLRAEGWKIGQARFYEHIKEGKLGRDDTGQFTSRLVTKYAKTFLKRSATGKTVKDDDADLQRQKLVEEIRVKRIEGERNQLKLDAERGLYLRRDAVEMELAGRAAALEAGFDHLIYTRAAEWIAIVKGDQARADQMIAALMAAKDEWLNIYASAGEFTVIIQPANPEEEQAL